MLERLKQNVDDMRRKMPSLEGRGDGGEGEVVFQIEVAMEEVALKVARGADATVV